MNLIGLVSSYKEGALVQGAIRSLVPWCDHTLVYEGQAGASIDNVPDSDFGPWEKHDKVTLHRGRWRTDARKRQAMLDASKRWDGPVWGVIVDADEVLFGGEYLRDWLQRLEWQEEISDVRFQGKPMRIVELDGNVSWVKTRLLRLDRIQNYELSTSLFKNDVGVIDHKLGNIRDSYTAWAEPRAKYFEEDIMLVHPPIPTEPFLLHRSGLRHPLRAGLRMNEQETREIEKRKEREAAAV